jgi:membrane-bound metal-dependent hydrolase YbcI (DUF457 family)
VSWVAHDLEPYVFQRKLGKTAGISFVALVLGSWGPDMFTKWFAYGVGLAGLKLKASDPVQFQRGWPGVGFTHSLTFGVAVAALVYLVTRSTPWALGLLIGIWLHTFSDTGDTVGTMLFFPWTHHFAIGAWRYTAHLGRIEDAAAYYSGPAFVWDAIWVALALACWPVLRRSYFHERIAPRDGFWAWSGRLLPECALVAVYRGAIFYGLCRFTSWMVWAHVLHHHPFDPTWGGPHWAPSARS